jgi:hypothetical protein
MMTSTLITLICLIVFLFGGTVLVMLKAMNQKNFGDETENELQAQEADRSDTM